MKLYFDVKTLTGETVSLTLLVTSQDTVKAIKERIASAEPNPFPEQALLFKGGKLRDGAKVSECGLQDGDRLAFEARASEEALAAQLQDLLRTSGPVVVQELGLMYSLKHGVTISQALQALGKNELLTVFLEKMSKAFLIEGGKVRNAQASLALKAVMAQTAPGTQLLTVTVLVTLQLPSMTQDPVEHKVSVKGSESVRRLKECVAVPVPLANQQLRLEGKTLSDEVNLADAGIVDGSRLDLVASASEASLVKQLVMLLTAHGPMSRRELENMFCLSYGACVAQAMHLLGWGEKCQHFLERHSTFVLERGCVFLAPMSPIELASRPEGNAPYLALHAKLYEGGFLDSVENALDGLANIFSKETFLNIARVGKGGAAANGTAIPGAVGAELVLFVEGLPLVNQDVWLPGLVTSVACGIGERLVGQQGIQEVRAEGSTLCITTGGPLGDVTVFLSPAYANCADALEALGKQGPAARAVGASAFAEQRVRFMQRQPGGVKAAIRLVKWWRQQQQWSSAAARPSDTLLELVVAHTVAKRKPQDLREAVDAALRSLANFGDLRVEWPLSSRSYRETDLPPGVLEQQPLVMDPANPFVNAADPGLFQPDELAEQAKSGMPPPGLGGFGAFF